MRVGLDLCKVWVVGQGRSSKINVKCQKSCFDITVPLPQGQVQRLGSGPRAKVKVQGQGQAQGERSIFWHAAVDIRASDLPSAVKSNRSNYQSEVFVCVSIISGHMRVIAQMQSICF